MSKEIFEKIIRIAKKRGFFYQSCEIYKPISGFWHYGSVGVLLKKKIEEEWRRFFIKNEGFYEIEGTNIMPKDVFVASGHLKGFSDPIVQCKKCNSLYRADKLIYETLGIFVPERAKEEEFDKIIKEKNVRCIKCRGELMNTRFFNMMFELGVGASEKREIAYLRPETCQSIFVDFLNVYRAMRARLPFGIAQIGRSFRNEISPRQGLLRQREFTQAEAEIFFDPSVKNFEGFEKIKNTELNILRAGKNETEKMSLEEMIKNGIIDNELFGYYLAKVQEFINSLGIPLSAIRFREQEEEERPFYAKLAFDCEVYTPIGWIEIVANHYRSDHDLKSHSEISGKDLSIIVNNKKIIPHVWEISQGIDRTLFCVMMHAFKEDERGWSYFSFEPKIAPYSVAVFPLVSKDGLPEKAKEVYKILRKDFDTLYDESGSIGKRYARADEIGVPFCITIDYQTLEDNTVTIRDVNTTEQVRIKIDNISDFIKRMIS